MTAIKYNFENRNNYRNVNHVFMKCLPLLFPGKKKNTLIGELTLDSNDK
jgi:hypothetical protein